MGQLIRYIIQQESPARLKDNEKTPYFDRVYYVYHDNEQILRAAIVTWDGERRKVRALKNPFEIRIEEDYDEQLEKAINEARWELEARQRKSVILPLDLDDKPGKKAVNNF